MVSSRYFSVYQMMKSGPCAYSCKHDGECEKCPEYGDIREQAAIDHNRLLKVNEYLKSKCGFYSTREVCYSDTCECREFCTKHA